MVQSQNTLRKDFALLDQTLTKCGCHLRLQVEKAYNAMERAGIQVQDPGPWNLVWDGDRLTVIDFLAGVSI